jgi:hypothetical protein
MNKEKDSLVVCLLPTGSANENINGISHLLEHLLIVKFLHTFKVKKPSGYTTEDYVIMFLPGIPLKKIMETLQGMSIGQRELESHKRILIKEIERESANEQEAFFRFVWHGTGSGYEKSPLGTVEDVHTITVDMLEELRREILKKQLFFYSNSTGLETLNASESENMTDTRVDTLPSSFPGINVTWRRDKTYQVKGKTRCYNICYFNSHIEAFYLLQQILKALNPGKHIQLSEKKRMSALIIEAGVQFPTANNIEPLREQTLRELDLDLSEIKENFRERALNELESCYFYGKSWQERIRQLFQTTDRQLLSMVREITKCKNLPYIEGYRRE